MEGTGSIWEVTGELIVSDPGEAHLTIADGGVVRSSNVTRVNALGRITLDGGRLEAGGTTALLNTGIVEGFGTIESQISDNNAGGQIRARSRGLVFTGSLTNAGLVDVQSGEFEVVGPTSNSSDIDARDGAILRFGGSGLDNNATPNWRSPVESSMCLARSITMPTPRSSWAAAPCRVSRYRHEQWRRPRATGRRAAHARKSRLCRRRGAHYRITRRRLDRALQRAVRRIRPGASDRRGVACRNVGGGVTRWLLPMAGDFFQIVSAGGDSRVRLVPRSCRRSPPGWIGTSNTTPTPSCSLLSAPRLLGDYNQNGVVDAAD